MTSKLEDKDISEGVADTKTCKSTSTMPMVMQPSLWFTTQIPRGRKVMVRSVKSWRTGRKYAEDSVAS